MIAYGDKCPHFIWRLVYIVGSKIRRPIVQTLYHSIDVNIGELYLNSYWRPRPRSSRRPPPRAGSN